jgi:hypothetical protein
VAVSFFCGGNWINGGKTPTCRKSLTNFFSLFFSELTDDKNIIFFYYVFIVASFAEPH